MSVVCDFRVMVCPGRFCGMVMGNVGVMCVRFARGECVAAIIGVTVFIMFTTPRRQVCGLICIGHFCPDRKGEVGVEGGHGQIHQRSHGFCVYSSYVREMPLLLKTGCLFQLSVLTWCLNTHQIGRAHV